MPAQADAVDDMATQAYDNMSQGGGCVKDEEMMALEYDAEPAKNGAETGDGKQESQASDAVPTQVIQELDQCVEGVGGKRGGSPEAVSPSSMAPTQVFDPCRSQSQSDGIATQTFDAGNSRQANSQTDFLPTQIFYAISATSKNSDGSPNQNMARLNSQDEPATQVFEAVTTMQQKSAGSPGWNSRPSNSKTDLLAAPVFCEPAAIAAKPRRRGGSPQQSTQTFSAAHPPRRTSSIGKDGTRISFSPQSYSTQDLHGEPDFPHLTLEMSECSDTHDERSSTAAQDSSLHQVICLPASVKQQ